MAKKPHRSLPDLAFLESKYEYDPVSGGLFRKGEEHTEENALGSWTRAGYKIININKQVWLLHRICFYMYHRKDPGKLMVDHINGDKGDNRIHNLRRCQPTSNARNLRSKGKYVVDEEGVGRWVSGVVKSKQPLEETL